MRTSGRALAEQVLDYLAFRARASSDPRLRSTGSRSTRILITQLPTGVLQGACRYLVAASGARDGEDLVFDFDGAQFRIAIALIQSVEEVAAGRLSEEDGYRFGASPDYPVGLRNRVGNVLVAVPPDLLHVTHESLKSNSFQLFQDNQRFGTELRVFTRIAETLLPRRPETRLVAELLRTIRHEESERFGQLGDHRSFERIDALAEWLQTEPTLDWRLLGLLPQVRLVVDPQRGASPRSVALAVKENFRFQSDLVEGLAKEQFRYVSRKFGQSSFFDRVVEFLSKREFRLGLEDDSWRREWPADLPIESLGPRQPRRPDEVKVRTLRVDASTSALGVPVVDAPFTISWRFSNPPGELRGNILVDGQPVQGTDLLARTAFVQDCGAPGFHTVGLEAHDATLGGRVSAKYFVPTPQGSVLATVDNSLPGQGSYQVAPSTSFRLRWTVVPRRTRIDEFVVTVQSTQADESVRHRLGAAAAWIDFPGGTEDALEITVEAQSAGLHFATRVRVDPVEHAVQERTASTVGRALLLAARDLSPEEDRAVQAIDFEAGGDTYEVRLLTEDSLEVSTIRPLSSEILDSFERGFLDAPGIPWCRVLARTRQGRGMLWRALKTSDDFLNATLGDLPQPELDRFNDARRRALAPIAEAGGVGVARLSGLGEQIAAYATAYRDLLSALASGEDQVTRGHVLAGLVDCILVPGEPVFVREDAEDTSPAGAVAAVFVSPTHPLRLAWHYQFEVCTERMLLGPGRWSALSMEALDSKNVPPCLLGWDFEHFHACTTAVGGRWGVMIREGNAELDKLIPPQFSRHLDLDSPREVTAATPLQLSSAIIRYKELRPHRDAMRIAYLNPGSGEKLLEAVEKLVSGRIAPRGELAVHTAGTTQYDLSLLDVFDVTPDWRTGSAFGAYAGSSESDQEVLSRVLFAVHHVSARTFATGDVEVPTAHIMFGSDMFRLTGRTEPIAGKATTPGFGALIVNASKVFERGETPRVLSHALVSRPVNWGCALEGNRLDDAMHGILFGLQAIAAAGSDRRTSSETQGRVLLADVDEQTRRMIERMHDLSDWVYLMDSHVDVEYFDQPDLGEKYVIDYVPRLLAGASSSRAHNYVITTRRSTAITSAINRFIYSAYGRDLVPEGAAERLSSALNRISGHLLLKLIGDPAWAKGAVGLGLLQILHDHGDLIPGAPQDDGGEMRVLVPIDDYIGEWLREFRSLRGGSTPGTHGDLLDISAQIIGSDVALVFQVIEVKNRRVSYLQGDLRSGPFQQVAQTARLLEALFGVGTSAPRADRPVKDYQLAQLLDFYLRRTSMQRWGNDSALLERARRFRVHVFESIAAGRYEANWRGERGRPLLGAIVHFNAAQEYGGGRPELVAGEAEDVLYVHFGKRDIGALLGTASPEGLGDFRQALDPHTSRALPARGGERAGERVPTPPAERLAADESQADPVLERVARAFQGFVGNDEAIRRLTPYLANALSQDPPRLRLNVAFTGAASTGKTELSRRVARVLGLPYVGTTGSALNSLDDLLERMETEVHERDLPFPEVGREGGRPVRRFPPMLVFVDEAHEIRRPVQESLLTLLEPEDRRGVGTRFVGDATHVAFIFATTEWGDLLNTLQTRLEPRIPLQPYGEDQVAAMVRARYPDWPEEIAARLAVAGRLIPRVALQRAHEFANALEYMSDRDPLDLLDEYYGLWQIDPLGISEGDRRYLILLDRNADPVGLQRLCNQLNLGQREITGNVEPFLVQRGLVEITTQGRRLTEQGKRYVRSLGAS